VVAAFFDEDCYLFQASDFLAALRELTSEDEDNEPAGLLPA